jgi:hypothetical protein
MPLESQNREEHFALLKTRLESLRELYSAGSNSGEYLELFDEYLEHREFGLALDRLCDFLLEPDVRPVSKVELEQIAALYALMEVEDLRVLRLKNKCLEFEEADGRQ